MAGDIIGLTICHLLDDVVAGQRFEGYHDDERDD